tara:strand:- start:442 stop:651 length:210 start_codon:yes stop_codon:yes gene_type:complete
LRVLEVAFQVERAKLRDKKLKVIPEDTVKIWVNSAFLKVLDSPLLMSVHPHHRFGHNLILLAFPPILEV